MIFVVAIVDQNTIDENACGECPLGPALKNVTNVNWGIVRIAAKWTLCSQGDTRYHMYKKLQDWFYRWFAGHDIEPIVVQVDLMRKEAEIIASGDEVANYNSHKMLTYDQWKQLIA